MTLGTEIEVWITSEAPKKPFYHYVQKIISIESIIRAYFVTRSIHEETCENWKGTLMVIVNFYTF